MYTYIYIYNININFKHNDMNIDIHSNGTKEIITFRLIRNYYIEANDFQQVIIHHRNVVCHTTVRKLTKCGTIVNFETNKWMKTMWSITNQ